MNWVEELGLQFKFIWTGDVDQFPSWELEMSTSSLHLSWKCWSVHLKGTRDEITWIKYSAKRSKLSKFIQTAQMNRLRFPIQYWKELLDISSSHERKFFKQFLLFLAEMELSHLLWTLIVFLRTGEISNILGKSECLEKLGFWEGVFEFLLDLENFYWDLVYLIRLEIEFCVQDISDF